MTSAVAENDHTEECFVENDKNNFLKGQRGDWVLTASILLLPFLSLMFITLFFGLRLCAAIAFTLLPCFALYLIRILLTIHMYRAGNLAKEELNFWIIYLICLCFGAWIGLKMLNEPFYGQCITIYILLEPLFLQFMALPRIPIVPSMISSDDPSFSSETHFVDSGDGDSGGGGGGDGGGGDGTSVSENKTKGEGVTMQRDLVNK